MQLWWRAPIGPVYNKGSEMSWHSNGSAKSLAPLHVIYVIDGF
jgi:hypothetical protein